MRTLFGVIGSLYLVVGSANGLFTIPSAIQTGVIVLYFSSLLLDYLSMLRWPQSIARRFINIFMDIFCATVVINYSGGPESPGFLLYIWLLTSNAMRFRMREVYVSQVGSILAYGFILFNHPQVLVHPIQVIFQCTALLIFPIYLHRLIAIQGKARKHAEETNRLKSQFLANMSHELRTPLNAIIGYSEMMHEEAENRGQGQYVGDLEHVLRSSRHLLGLINELLDIAKIEAGKVELHLQEFNLPQLLHELVYTIQPHVEKNQNRLISDFRAAPRSMHSDPAKVQQILLNLLANAAKFTKHGEVHFTASEEQQKGRSYVCIQVRDTGIGIAPEQQSTIFQPFVQADGSSTRRYGGTGLGLAISKQYTEMLGGQISLSSQAAVGSTFSVRLPTES